MIHMKKPFTYLLILFSIFIDPLNLLKTEAFAAGPECEAVLSKLKFEEGVFIQSQGYPIFFKDYRVPRAKGQVVISNGMHYELAKYDDVIAGLIKNGYNVLVYAHRTQHESLAAAKERSLDFKSLSLNEMAQDLAELLIYRKINKKINLVGLSFGASVAAAYAAENPTRVNTLSFWAPLIYLSPAFDMMRDLQNSFSLFNPFGFGVPKYSAPTEAMLDAVKDFDLNKYSFDAPVSLTLAGQDESVLLRQQKEYWEQTLKQQGGRLKFLAEAHHTLPDSAPMSVLKTLLAFINIKAKSKKNR